MARLTALLAAAVLAATALVAPVQAAHNDLQWVTYSGSQFTELSGVLRIPRRPSNSGTYYVWPGLQPTDGVLQQVCDGRTGNWWIGSGYYGTPSLPWGAGFSTSPGTAVTFKNTLNTGNGVWTSTLSQPGSADAVSTFALSGHPMQWAVFDVELYSVGWDFGPVTYDRVYMASTTTSTGWCTTTPYTYGSVGYSIGSVVGAKISGGTSCTLTNFVMWNPTAQPADFISTLPKAAYSLRKVTESYKGAAIRVRRSSDNTFKDIGFSGFDLDTATLLAFAPAGTDAFVQTWYDQSGSGNHAVQNTAANQPKIVSSGTLITLPPTTSGATARPAVSFVGANKNFLSLASYPLAGASGVSAYIVNKIGSAQAWSRYFDFGVDTNTYIFATPQANDGTSRFRISTGGSASEQGPVDSGISNTKSHLVQFSHKGKGSSMSISVDGSTLSPSVSSVSLGAGDIAPTNNFIGRSQFSVDPYLDGLVSEIYFYNSDITTGSAQHSAFLSNVRSYYGI